jgi:O-antigen/teichoic acid export membrane protein
MNFLKNTIISLKGLVVIGSADILGMAIAATFWLLLASLMSVKEYGEIIYFIAISSIAYSSSIVGSTNTISVFSLKNPKAIPSLLLLSLIFSLLASLIVFFITQKFELVFLVIVFLIFDTSVQILLGKKLYIRYAKFFLTQKILLLILGLSLYYILGFDGVLIGIILSHVPLLIIFSKEICTSKFDFSILKLKKDFIITNHGIQIVQIFRRDIDKIIIVPLLGLTILGNFALALQFYTLLMIISSISFKYLVPKDIDGTNNKKLKKLLILLSIIIAISSFFISPFLINNLFSKFSESILPIQIISFSVIPGTITLILYSKLLALEKSKLLIISSIIQLCFVLIGTIILGLYYGIIGIAISFLISSTVHAGSLAVFNYNFIGSKKFDI